MGPVLTHRRLEFAIRQILNASVDTQFQRLARARQTNILNVGNGVLQAYLDVFNVYNQANLRGYAYHPQVNDGVVTVIQGNGEELLPILPTIGFRWEF